MSFDFVSLSAVSERRLVKSPSVGTKTTRRSLLEILCSMGQCKQDASGEISNVAKCGVLFSCAGVAGYLNIHVHGPTGVHPNFPRVREYICLVIFPVLN